MNTKRIFKLGAISLVSAAAIAWIGVTGQEYMQSRASSQYVGTGGPPRMPGMPNSNLDVPYVPTPEPVVEQMLKMAAVKAGDVVYDLGCGDGRIVITAAKQFGARGTGVDIDPQRIKESKANAKAAGVTDRVQFIQRDLFKMDLKDATVVTLYLLPEINLKLRPKLFKELRPGTRIVSHDFDMGDWKPEKTLSVRDQREHVLHYWTIPEKSEQPTAARAGSS